MTELQELSRSAYQDMLARAEAGIAAMDAARDERYAEDFLAFLDEIVEDVPITETPNSNYAGHRTSFTMKGTNGREYVVAFDLRDVKRSNERKAEKAAAEAAEKALAEKAETPAETEKEKAKA